MATVNVYSPDDVIALGACKYWDVDIATSKNIWPGKWAGNQSHDMWKRGPKAEDVIIFALIVPLHQLHHSPINNFLSLSSSPFYNLIYFLWTIIFKTWPSQFLCRPNFLASDIGYQCDVDIVWAIFTIICQCSCSHVNVCHSLFNV